MSVTIFILIILNKYDQKKRLIKNFIKIQLNYDFMDNV